MSQSGGLGELAIGDTHRVPVCTVRRRLKLGCHLSVRATFQGVGDSLLYNPNFSARPTGLWNCLPDFTNAPHRRPEGSGLPCGAHPADVSLFRQRDGQGPLAGVDQGESKPQTPSFLRS